MVVQAHPVEDSFNRAVFDAVIAAFEQQDRPVSTVRIGEHEPMPADLESVEQLIVIYPTWYGSLPAMLLDAMARLMGPWIDDGEPADTAPLRSVRSLKVITTHGSSKLINMLQGEPGLQLWKRTVLALCAPGATFGWMALYKLDRNDAAERDDFLTQASHFATS